MESSDEEIEETPEAIAKFRAGPWRKSHDESEEGIQDSPSLIVESDLDESALASNGRFKNTSQVSPIKPRFGGRFGESFVQKNVSLQSTLLSDDSFINDSMGSVVKTKQLNNNNPKAQFGVQKASTPANDISTVKELSDLDDSVVGPFSKKLGAKPKNRFMDNSTSPTELEHLCNSLSMSKVTTNVSKKTQFETEQEESGEDSPVFARSKKTKAKKNFLDDSDDEADNSFKHSNDESIEVSIVISDSEDQDFVKSEPKARKPSNSKNRLEEESDDYESAEESPVVARTHKLRAKNNNRLLDESSSSIEEIEKGQHGRGKVATKIEEISSDDEESEDEEESDYEDEDDEYIESSDEDFEVPKPKTPKPKTPKPNLPKKGLPKPVIQDDDEVTEIYPSPSESKNKFVYDDASTSPFDVGQKFTPAEVGVLNTKLTAVRKSIESNTRLLMRKQNLPDNGQRLKEMNAQLRDKESELLAKLMHAKDNMDESPKPANPTEALANTLADLHLKEKMLRQRYGATRIELLPDKGAALQSELREFRQEITKVETQLKLRQNQLRPNPTMSKVPSATNLGKHAVLLNELPAKNWSEKLNFGVGNLNNEKLYADAPAANQLYGGRMNQVRRNVIGTVTSDALKSLHDCLKEMPTEKDEESDPRGLKKNITLFPHQRQGLAWMLWRETKNPPGGILADDMGLGKTLTLLALIVKHKEIMSDRGMNASEEEKENEWLEKMPKNLIRSKATLVICPASLIGHWEKEANDKLKSGVMSVLVYHGANRGQSARSLAKYDLIVTTYGTVMSEMKGLLAKTKEVKLDDMVTVEDEGMETKNVQLLSVIWERVILDEAHQIRNPKAQTALAVCKLRASRRWAVTGTPIQNKELDLYSLIRFFRLSPFDEYRVWKLWVDNKTVMGQERMNTLVKSMLLRRTKDQKNTTTGKAIVDLPAKSVQEHKIILTDQERKVYDEVFSFSQQAMLNYMLKNQDKKEEKEFMDNVVTHGKLAKGDGFAFQKNVAIAAAHTSGAIAHIMPKSLGDNKDVKAHHLLVLLLRLRQICCHPGLIKSMLDAESKATEGLEDERGDDIDLISQLADMSLRSDKEEDSVLDRANPIFEEKKPSSKISTVIEELQKLKKRSDETGEMEKAVIVSQWTSMLEIMKNHVNKIEMKCSAINGTVPIKTRGDIVNDFNRKNKGAQVMLLSLAAGGVGLNLVGANHLFLIDMHWNPQLEQQACDRIYRVGQEREVTIHKFLCVNTVESRILELQSKKLELAKGVLTGAQSRGATKMTFDDLKKIFELDQFAQKSNKSSTNISAASSSGNH